MASRERNAPEYVISVLRTGSIRILSDVTGWSLPARAIELGAAALYRVGRQGAVVQVEGWSYGRKCVLSRDSLGPSGMGPSGMRPPAYATFHMLEAGGVSQNDRAPQVRNS